MLAKWFETDPSILVIDEPTKGVDIGAKQQIHAELRRRRDAGTAILLISSDWLELLCLTDTIMVVREGRIAARVLAEDATEDDLLALASGVGLNPASGMTAPEPP